MLQIVMWLLYAGVLYISFFLLVIMLEQSDIRRPVEWLDEWPEITLIIPVFNEEDTIKMTIESVLSAEYPEDKLDIVVVNDGSTDNTKEILQEYEDNERISIVHQENKGKGAALNRGLEETDSKLIGCVDADSRLSEEALKNIVSELSEDEAGIASAMKVHEPGNLLQKLQWVEYIVSIFSRKLMGLLNAIHVTPGPLSIYKRSIIERVGGFDEESRVEDQEICIRLQKHHHKVGYSRKGEVFTVAPDTLRKFYEQRYRWYRGSLETIMQYREMFLNPKYGDFGMYALPSKLVSAVLSVMGLLLITYTGLKPVYQVGETFSAIGFDALEFGLPEIQEMSSEIQWLILSQNYMLMTLIAALIIFSLTMAYMASKYTEENLLEHGILAPAVYIFWFFLLLGIVWLKVLLDVLTEGVENAIKQH